MNCITEGRIHSMCQASESQNDQATIIRYKSLVRTKWSQWLVEDYQIKIIRLHQKMNCPLLFCVHTHMMPVMILFYFALWCALAAGSLWDTSQATPNHVVSLSRWEEGSRDLYRACGNPPQGPSGELWLLGLLPSINYNTCTCFWQQHAGCISPIAILVSKLW